MDTLVFFYVGLLFFILVITRSFMSFGSKKNTPPQPWSLPIVGHIHHLQGAQAHKALKKLAQKLGPIVGLQLGELSTVIISSPPLAKEIFKTHDISFANRNILLNFDIIFHNTVDLIFCPYGDYWRQMRKLCVTELLSAKKVESFQHIREQESWNLVESLATQRSKTINLSSMIFTLINTIISRTTFGSRCKDQAMIVDCIQELTNISSGMDICSLFPSIPILQLVTGRTNKLMKIRKKFDLLVDRIIQEHKERHASGYKNEEDIVDVLLRIQDDGGLGFPLKTRNIKAIILDMFGAGSDTSAATIEWAMSELMKNPRVMKKAQDEIREVLKGRTKIHDSDILELKYLKQVVKETLRLHGPVALIPRECREDCEIRGFNIKAKTIILINAWMISRDPDYWSDPESFIPERFSESSVNMMGTDFEFLPFGAGRRICPGLQMGLANVELPLAMLLYHFNWELPNGLTFEDFDMSETLGSTLKRKNDLLLVPHEYSNTDY